MKLKLYKIILLLNFLIPICIVSQSDLDNHKKYWHYKTRLNNDFVNKKVEKLKNLANERKKVDA